MRLTGETPVLRGSDVAKVSDAMKKHQAEQAEAERAAAGPPLAVPPDVAVTPHAPGGAVAVSASASPAAAPVPEAPSPAAPACRGRLARVVRSIGLVVRRRRIDFAARCGQDARETRGRDARDTLPDARDTERIADAYRALRTNLLAMCGDEGFCFLVTSARNGEGKTLTAANLAWVLAECATRNVLLIDADLRRPGVAGVMGLSPAPGLAELIRGQATLLQVLQPTTCPNFSVIAAGTADPREVAELLARPTLHTLLTEARRMFDHVLIDTPPIHRSDVGTLGQVCRQALLVVRAGRTRQEDVARAVALLHAANIHPAGMVLTGSRSGC